MQRLLNDDWRFVRLPYGSTLTDALAADHAPVDLPHDAFIHDVSDLYPTCDLWYQRTLTVPDTERDVLLCFDGVYMDCDVLVNGEIVCTHHHGYTAFTADLTRYVHPGDNDVRVHCRLLSSNARWYSGAGIFRDVTLQILDRSHIVPDSVRFRAERMEGSRWRVTVDCELTSQAHPVTHRLLGRDGKTVLTLPGDAFGFATGEISDPSLWHPAAPVLYTLESVCGDQVIRQNAGFREITLTPDRGLFVNGDHVKLLGVCLHHDLGALGAAFNEAAARRQLLLMRDMGANALRTSHNPPARQVLDLCDELGILVVDEFTDMWHRSKTEGDYARFFDADCRRDVADWVRRDRNHPCVIMWSIGNEIADTMQDPPRADLSVLLRDETRRHDDRPVTLASNYMPWEGGQRCSEMLDAQGYNYAEKYYEPHHREHPDWIIYGSETGSCLYTRGIYHFPMAANILSDEDLQCSALGNSYTSWGTQDLQHCIFDDLNMPFSLGQFVWTGTDYIGEPTPYHTRSSYFGLADTAGFPKDVFYRFRAAWNPEKMIHIGVPWQWNPGQLIDVPVMTNCPAAELFLNGQSLGRKAVNNNSAEGSLPVWQLPFAPGILTAVAYDAHGDEVCRTERHSYGNTAVLSLSTDRERLSADGRDMAFITVQAVDA